MNRQKLKTVRTRLEHHHMAGNPDNTVGILTDLVDVLLEDEGQKSTNEQYSSRDWTTQRGEVAFANGALRTASSGHTLTPDDALSLADALRKWAIPRSPFKNGLTFVLAGHASLLSPLVQYAVGHDIPISQAIDELIRKGLT